MMLFRKKGNVKDLEAENTNYVQSNLSPHHGAVKDGFTLLEEKDSNELSTEKNEIDDDQENTSPEEEAGDTRNPNINI